MGAGAPATCADELSAEQALCAAHKCDPVWQCITQSGCSIQKGFPDPFTGLPGIELIDCYCGEMDVADYARCFSAVVDVDPLYPKGACKQQIETLVGSQDPKVIGPLFNDATSALHALNAYVNCANVNCLADCKCDLSGSSGSCGAGGAANTGGASAGGAGSGGSSGGMNAGATSSGGTNAGGTSSGGTSSGGMHSGGSSGSGGAAGSGGGGGKGGAACDTCATAHCSDAVNAVTTQCAGGKCDALKQCISMSFCDETLRNTQGNFYTIDPRQCFCGAGASTPQALTQCINAGTPNAGPCVAQMGALVGGASNIPQNFSNSSTPLGALMNLRTCEGQSCAAECCTICQ